MTSEPTQRPVTDPNLPDGWVFPAAPIRPFDGSGIERAEDGRLRYTALPTTIPSMLLDVARRRPDREAVVEVGGRRLTYEALIEAARRFAAGLAAEGVRPGDRVAIRLPNGVEWVVAFVGCQFAGAVAVPINIRFSDAEVDFVVTDADCARIVEPNQPQRQAPSDRAPNSDGGIHRRADDLAALFYTSGTTGFPKGAMLTHENILATCENRTRVTQADPGFDLRNLISVPLFHVTACLSQLMFTLYRGGTAVIMPQFDVRAFLRALVTERISICTTVPAIWWLALTQPGFDELDLSALRHLSYGGAPMAPEVIARLRAAVPGARLGNGYGLTETSAIATFLPDEWCDSHTTTVGLAAPVVEVALADVDAATGVGELVISGQNVVRGYWRSPERTAEAFVGRWLRTGDLARIDEGGFVEIVDRKKDMVNRGGENVYCVEVENALAAHPAIAEVAVVGVPDPMMGEKVGAVVVLVDGAQFDPHELRAWAVERIADFKVPQFVTVRSEPLPRNAGGKVLKPVLRDSTIWGDQLR